MTIKKFSPLFSDATSFAPVDLTPAFASGVRDSYSLHLPYYVASIRVSALFSVSGSVGVCSGRTSSADFSSVLSDCSAVDAGLADGRFAHK